MLNMQSTSQTTLNLHLPLQANLKKKAKFKLSLLSLKSQSSMILFNLSTKLSKVEFKGLKLRNSQIKEEV
jgi:hypothetical protein